MRRMGALVLAAVIGLVPLSACGSGDAKGTTGGSQNRQAADSGGDTSGTDAEGADTGAFDDSAYCDELDTLYADFVYPIDEDLTLKTYSEVGPELVTTLNEFSTKAPEEIRPAWVSWHDAVSKAVPIMRDLAEFIAVVESDDPAAQEKLNAMSEADYQKQNRRYDKMYTYIESETKFTGQIEVDAESRCGWAWEEE